jgi:hypothetical protein
VGSFIEVLRAVPRVAQAEVGARLLAGVRVPRARRLADCTATQARRFGITAAIQPLTDYASCRRWAEALAGAGFAGIRYRVSHDPSAAEVGLALFGDEGVDDSVLVDEDGPIPQALLDEVQSRFGILVLPSPS